MIYKYGKAKLKIVVNRYKVHKIFKLKIFPLNYIGKMEGKLLNECSDFKVTY